MQVLMGIFCEEAKTLRKALGGDTRRLAEYGLEVIEEQGKDRIPGRKTLRSIWPDREGQVNVKWQGSDHLLMCRVIAEGDADPSRLAGDLTAYLLRRHRKGLEIICTLARDSG